MIVGEKGGSGRERRKVEAGASERRDSILSLLSSLLRPRDPKEREADWGRERPGESESERENRERKDHRRSDFRWSLLEKSTERGEDRQTQKDPKPRRTGVETRPFDQTQTWSSMGHCWRWSQWRFPAVLAENPATSSGDFPVKHKDVFRWISIALNRNFWSFLVIYCCYFGWICIWFTVGDYW